MGGWPYLYDYATLGPNFQLRAYKNTSQVESLTTTHKIIRTYIRKKLVFIEEEFS